MSYYQYWKKFPFVDYAIPKSTESGTYKSDKIVVMEEWASVYDSEKIRVVPKYKYYDAIYIPEFDQILVDAPVSVVFALKENGRARLRVTIVDYKPVMYSMERVSVAEGVSYSYNSVDGVQRVTLSEEFIAKDCRGVLCRDYGDCCEAVKCVSEELTDDDFRAVVSNISTVCDSPVILRLRAYLKGGYTTNRAPLLVGESAVGKSALVKMLTVQLGYRLVDIRTAFMSRLDIEGLTEIIREDSEVMSTTSPMAKLVECSDEYIDFCTRTFELLKNEEDTDEVLRMRSRCLEGMKTPVLFFDEVTRGEMSVRQALTKILTDREFGGLHLTKCKIIGATNSRVDREGNLIDDVYLTKSVTDVAFLDRWESIWVYSSDMVFSWYQWAESCAFNADVLEFLKKNSYYLVQDYTTNDMGYQMTANFRTWEMVSTYLQNSDKTYNEKYLRCCLGSENVVNDLTKFLKEKGYREEKVEDFYQYMIECAVDRRVPALLCGPSSVGKTARVMTLCRERGYELININLAEKDRLDLSGPPAKQDIIDYVLGDTGAMDISLRDSLILALYESNLPTKVTVRAPREDLVRMFESALKRDKVVIFFDEINRVPNASLMSAVFEVISDNRLFGVEFDPNVVAVIAACNPVGYASDVFPLDPALSNRFATYYSESVTDMDVLAFRRYLSRADLNRYVKGWLDSVDDKYMKMMLESVSDRDIRLSSASSRGIEDLSRYLDVNLDSVVHGTMFGSEWKSRQALEDVIAKRDKSGLATVIDAVESRISNWAGLRLSRVVIKDKEVSPIELINFTKKKVEEFRKGTVDEEVLMTLLDDLVQVELNIAKIRGDLFAYFLGNYAYDFQYYYNNISGTVVDVITKGDIGTVETALKFIESRLSAVTGVEMLENTALMVLDDVIEMLGDRFGYKVYKQFILKCMEYLMTTESKTVFLRGIAADSKGKDRIVSFMEKDAPGSVGEILSKVGVAVASSLQQDVLPVLL